MRHRVGIALVGLGLLGLAGSQAAAQAVHEIRMEANEKRHEYTFVPAEVTARPGDVLLFRSVSGGPHSVVFEADGLPAAAQEALNGAMPRRSADLSSPLLTGKGAEYRITIPALPRGRYRFFCLPHRAYDMRGQLSIK